MEISFQLMVGIGLVLCALACGQLAFWSAGFVRKVRSEKQNFLATQHELRGQLGRFAAPQASTAEQVISGKTWRGFRNFVVQRLVKETENTTSVYLIPADGKPIPPFHSGQHITVRLTVPGMVKPLVRCYSLSDSSGKPYYRITVKECSPPEGRPDLGFGKASHFINRQLREGQVIEVKAPSGDFCLKEDSERLIVLLAGGIGITPMISMLNRLIELQSPRLILLVYGVRNSREHAFKSYLQQLHTNHSPLHLIQCYSQPLPADRLGTDYQIQGRANVDLLRKVLATPDAEFYLCGPAGFMNSFYDGLIDWGVNPADVRFEAFCPASVTVRGQAAAQPEETNGLAQSMASSIKFARSDITVLWNGQQSLLETAEANQIGIDSGCRAGSCGTCRVALIRGEVGYPAGYQPDCPPMQCLTCIARPKGAIELDA